MPLINLDQADAFETAALPGSGDVDAGAGGLTTSSMANETSLEAFGLDTYTQSHSGTVSGDYSPQDSAVHVAPNLAGGPAEHPFWTFALLFAGMFLYKATVRSESGENVRVSVPSWFGVGLMATSFLLAEKIFFGLVQFPSVTPTMDFL